MDLHGTDTRNSGRSCTPCKVLAMDLSALSHRASRSCFMKLDFSSSLSTTPAIRLFERGLVVVYAFRRPRLPAESARPGAVIGRKRHRFHNMSTGVACARRRPFFRSDWTWRFGPALAWLRHARIVHIPVDRPSTVHGVSFVAIIRSLCGSFETKELADV
jgi:hypothetical protein